MNVIHTPHFMSPECMLRYFLSTNNYGGKPILYKFFLTHSYFFMPCSVQCRINNTVIFQHHPFDIKSDGCSKGQKVKLFWSMPKGM